MSTLYALNAGINTVTLVYGGEGYALKKPIEFEVKGLLVTTYLESTKLNAGTIYSGDHIPSFASLKRMYEAQLGRPLTSPEEKEIRGQSLVLNVLTKLHESTSLSFGGRNTKARQIADANNPLQAIIDNVNAYRESFLKAGYTNADVDRVIRDLSKPFKPAMPAPKK
jgi:hypothetical protein